MTQLRESIVSAALAWVGTPYRHQATTKGVGSDCLGLVRGVWREIYGSEPQEPGPYSRDWAETGSEDRLFDAACRWCTQRVAHEMQRGDLVLFRWRASHAAKHAGILLGRDSFIHAYEGSAVIVSSLVPQWRRRIAGVFAFPEIVGSRIASYGER